MKNREGTMSTLEEMIRKAAVIVEQKFAQDEAMAPYFYTELESGKRWLFDAGNVLEQFPWIEPIKDAFSMGMQMIFAMQKVDRYVMVMEAWAVGHVNMTKEEKDALDLWIASGKSASQHPQRYEIIQYQAEDIDGIELTARQDIIRPAGGKPYLGELEIQREVVESKGRFVRMLEFRKERKEVALKAKDSEAGLHKATGERDDS
jgi:hypothetical protein